MSFVNFEGIIGSGKSTALKNLHIYYGYPTFYESVKNNPVLKKFYKDMKRYSYHLQTEYLWTRYLQHKQALSLSSCKEHELVLSDRGLLFDDVFARLTNRLGLMEDTEYDTYLNLRNVMLSEVAFPHLIVYLDVKPEIAMERIRKRNRECEKDITIEYLQALYDEYDVMLEELRNHVPILRIDYNKFLPCENIRLRILHFLETNNYGAYFKLTRKVGD